MARSYFYTSKHNATRGRNYYCQEDEGTDFGPHYYLFTVICYTKVKAFPMPVFT